jgi:hypothetical protein
MVFLDAVPGKKARNRSKKDGKTIGKSLLFVGPNSMLSIGRKGAQNSLYLSSLKPINWADKSLD